MRDNNQKLCWIGDKVIATGFVWVRTQVKGASESPGGSLTYASRQVL